MDKAELDQIFSRVESGLDERELRRVADFVRRSTEPALQLRGLHILGWAGAKGYTSLIASFLDHTENLALPAMALRALVRWFHDAAPYSDVLKRFLLGIPQDDGRDLQLAALQVAGDAYRQTQDNGLLRMIVKFTGSDSEVFRDAAYDALATALSSNWEQLSPRQRYELRRPHNRDAFLHEASGLLS